MEIPCYTYLIAAAALPKCWLTKMLCVAEGIPIATGSIFFHKPVQFQAGELEGKVASPARGGIM